MTDLEDSIAGWWDWRLLGRWILVNAGAYVVIVVGGTAVLDQIVSGRPKELAEDHRLLVVVFIAVLGAAFQGFVLGRWQWQILWRRMPDLARRQWVMATFVPALIVWLIAIAPGVADTLAKEGDTLAAFKNGFIQALVLGPLIGLSQATALRDHTSRWMWWLGANVTTWLFGAITFEIGKWLVDVLSLPDGIAPAFPLLAFLIHGIWMLWVTAPEVVAHPPSTLTFEELRP